MIGVQAKMSFKDKGLKALIKKASEAGTRNVQLGVFEGVNGADADTVKRAAIHEYGAPEANIPQRSFLRSTVRENNTKYERELGRLLRAWMHNDISIEAAIYKFGLFAIGDVQRKIIRGIAPALQTATVTSKRRHGYARPNTALYATGELYNAVAVRAV